MTHNYLHNYQAKYAEFRSVFSSSLMSLVVWCTRKTRPFIFSKMLQQMPSYIFTLFFFINFTLLKLQFSHSSVVADCSQTRESWVRYDILVYLFSRLSNPGAQTMIVIRSSRESHWHLGLLAKGFMRDTWHGQKHLNLRKVKHECS